MCTCLRVGSIPLTDPTLTFNMKNNILTGQLIFVPDPQMEQGYRSEVQERALVVSLQMFNLILERGVALLRSQFDKNQRHRLIVDEDMQVLLPAIKVALNHPIFTAKNLVFLKVSFL